MSVEAITKLKKKRSTLRTSVTKSLTELEDKLSISEGLNSHDLEVDLEILTQNYTSLSKIDVELESHFTVDEFDKEFLKSEEYREKVVRGSFRATQKIKELKQNLSRSTDAGQKQISIPTDTVNSNVSKSNDMISIKLPKMTIAKFYGDVNQWLTFWASFESAIHNNKSIDNVQKFHYLKAHLAGHALDTIEALAITNSTYDVAIELLKERFAKTDLLIHTHMSNILNIKPLRNSNDTHAFRKFYDKISIELRSLENLGQSLKELSSVLCTSILKALPKDILIQLDKETEQNAFSDITQLLSHLSKCLHSRERAELIQNNKESHFRSFPPSRQSDSFSLSKSNYFHDKSLEKKNKEKNSFSTSDLLATNVKEKIKSICVFCNDDSHDSRYCVNAYKLSNAEKVSILKSKGACFRCLLRNHIGKFCKTKVNCSKCGCHHVQLMCNKIKKSNENDDQTIEQETEIKKVLSNQNRYSQVYLQTLIAEVKGTELKGYLRMLIDTGSENTYISKFAAKMLKLKGVNTENVRHGLFGGLEISETHNRYKFNLSSLDGKYNCDIEALDQKKICSVVPRVRDEKVLKMLKHKGICINDVREKEHLCLFEENPDEIHLLLGADCVAPLITERMEQFPELGITALETKLGWTLMGKMKSKNTRTNSSLSTLSLSLHVSDAKLADLWRLDTIGITNEENKTQSMLEVETQNHFLKTVKRDSTGRYEVNLPWIVDNSVLSSNRSLAEKSLHRTEQKLITSNKRKEYEEIFNYWETNEIIEAVHDENKPGLHFLPHRPVIKEASETTKIRPVFNASAHPKNSPSLNECLAKGPNLIELIPRILNRFRKYRIGVSSDIEKAFCQIKIAEKDRDFLCFLWLDSDKNWKCFRHNRIVFGLTSSPFLLAATINHLLSNVPEHFVETSEILKESFYIDNSLVSLDQIEETEKFICESKEILSSAHLNLRCWRSNMHIPMIVETEDNPRFVQALGLTWDLEKDTLNCKIIEPVKIEKPITKRKVLSVTQKIFDPIGFTAPVILIPKMILQETWIQKIKWDQELPITLNKRFNTWLSQLPLLSKIEIPRWLNIDRKNEDTISLHLFSDASKHAYATCAYLRVETEEGVKVQLVNARSRVAPIKELTIARLELLSCLISARLSKTVITDLKLENCRTVFWTDSSVSLGWIRRNQTWGTFVHNRAQEIRSLTKISDRRHVPGSYNPADLPSRGCSIEQLAKSRWWEGPSWLYLQEDQWPQTEEPPDEEVLNKERRKTVLILVDKEDNQDWYYRYFSSYRKTVRMIAWIFRFIYNMKNAEKNLSSDISVEEFEKAERILFKLIQRESFTSIKDPSIRALRPIEDENGIYRAKTNIIYRKDEKSFRYPVILPSNHPVIKRLIYEKHKEKQHVGVSTLMAHLRENVWILKSRKTIRNVIRQCVICKRFTVPRVEIEPGIPPEDRVREGSVFEVVGVDLAGPLYLVDGSKAWIVLYTCGIYRAIHLELITSLSTEAFIQSLRRFIARRGRPYVIYSDNGSNFTGTNKILAKVNWDEICAAANTQKIRWKFNPPTAAWWGGWWERLVRMVKEILRKVLGRTSVNYEELNTILCDCEQTINSRPITYVSEDNKDPSPLTPMMFLQELPSSGVPDIDAVDSKELTRRARYRQRLRTDLRNRFRNEYLGQLRQHALKKDQFKQLKVGDIVLVEDINKKRIHWPLAKIIDIFPGKDSVVRLARIKTANGTFLRPIPRLFPLEIDNADTNNFLFTDKFIPDRSEGLSSPPQSPGPEVSRIPDVAAVSHSGKRTPHLATTPPVVTRAGRVIKPPRRWTVSD